MRSSLSAYLGKVDTDIGSLNCASRKHPICVVFREDMRQRKNLERIQFHRNGMRSRTEVILAARLPIAVRAQFAIRKKAFGANGRESFAAAR